MKNIIILISVFVIAAVLIYAHAASPVYAANSCFGVSGGVTVIGPSQSGSFNVTCPGRPGLCPGDSQDVPIINGSYSLSGCNCLVGGGCVGISNLSSNCRIVSGAACYSNDVGNVSDDITVQCDWPERFKCVSNSCVSDGQDGTGNYPDIATCQAAGCGTTSTGTGSTCTSTPSTSTTSQCGGPAPCQAGHKCIVTTTSYSGCPSNPETTINYSDAGADPSCGGQPQCDPGFGVCGCSANCRDGSNTDFSCCHRVMGTCNGGSSASCTTIAGAGSNQCNNGDTITCPGTGSSTGTGTSTGPGTGPGTCIEGQPFCSSGECRIKHSGCDSSPADPSVCTSAGLDCGGSGPGTGSGPGSCGGGDCNTACGCQFDGSSHCCNNRQLACNGGTITDNGPGSCGTSKSCDPIGPFVGSPANMSTDMPSDVTLSWGTDDGPNGACSNSGRLFTLEWGHCDSPSQTSGNCVKDGDYDGNNAGGSHYCQNWKIGGMVAPVVNPWQYTLTGLSNGWHYWKTHQECDCHQCEPGGGETNAFLFFKVGPPTPNTPIKVCHPTSGRTDDICGPFSYTGPTNTEICVKNNDGSEPQAISFTLNNLSTAATNTGFGAPLPSTNEGQVVCTNTRALLPLSNGQTFTWTTESSNSLGTSPTDSNPWTFVYDDRAPSISFSTLPAECYDPSSPPPAFQFQVADTPPNPAQASGVASVFVRLDGTEYGPIARTGGDAYNGTYTFSWPALTAGVHQLFIKATDNVGNVSDYPATPNVQFSYSSKCLAPYIQTHQGGVHSNGGITAPGGP